MTIRAYDNVEVFDVYKALKLPTIYKELSSISIIDLASERNLLLSDDPLKRDLIGQDLYGDVEVLELAQVMNLAVIEMRKLPFEPLNRPIGPYPKDPIDCKTLQNSKLNSVF